MWIISIQICNPDAQDARNDQMYVGSQSLAFKVVYDKSFYTHYRSINHWPETEYVARAVFTLYGKKAIAEYSDQTRPLHAMRPSLWGTGCVYRCLKTTYIRHHLFR